MTKDEIPLSYLRTEDGTLRPLQGVESVFLTGTSIEICGLSDLVQGEGVDFITVPKENILADIQFRGAISDFHPIKDRIRKADYDPLLIKYNEDDRYGDGNNFELACCKEAADLWIVVAEKLRDQKRQEQEAAARSDAEMSLPKFRRTRVIKPWISQGSEKEVAMERTEGNNHGVVITARKKRRHFNQDTHLAETTSLDLWDPNTMECRPFKGTTLTLERKQRHCGIQSSAQTRDQAIQASGQRSVNANTQYEPQDLTEKMKEDLFSSNSMTTFLQNTFNRLEEVFLQNEVVDVLQDDFEAPEDESHTISDRKETLLKEHQSFADLTYSKAKIATHMEWSPFEKGFIAVAYMDTHSFETRSASCGKPQEYAILEWNISNAMRPQKVLLSQSEITTFQYNPRDKRLLAAGTFSGQILIWDIAVGKELSDETCINTCRPTFASALDATGSSPVTDLKWLPEYEMSKNGMLSSCEEAAGQCFLFVTCSSDGRLLFWDTRVEKSLKKGQHLDSAVKLNLKPVFLVPLFGLDSEDIALQCLCHTSSASSLLLAGTLNGDVLHADLKKLEGSDHPEITEDIVPAHAGAVTTIERCPFFQDTVMTVGGWSFKIWKDDHREPVFCSPYSHDRYTTGAWSSSRPAVIVLGTAAGVIEVWDLLDRAEKPSLATNVCSVPITSLSICPERDGRRNAQQLLAVGDYEGTMHLMIMPRALRRPLHEEQKRFAKLLQHQMHFIQDHEKRKNERQEDLPKKEDPDAAEHQPSQQTSISEKDEADYLALELEMRERLGLTQEG